MMKNLCQTAASAAAMLLIGLATCRVVSWKSLTNENGALRRLIGFENPFAHFDQNAKGQSRRRLSENCATLTDNEAFHIEARHSGKVLTIVNDSTETQYVAGSSVVQSTFLSFENTGFQHANAWVLAPTDTPGYYFVYNIPSLHFSLNVAGASTGNGANIIQWEWLRDPLSKGNNEWCFEPVGDGSDYYYIVARHSGKVIDINMASTADNANAIQYEKKATGGENQQFRLVVVVDGTPAPANPPTSPPNAADCDSACASHADYQALLSRVNSLTNELESLEQRLDLVESGQAGP